MSRWWQKKTFSEQQGGQKAGKSMFKWTEREENKRNVGTTEVLQRHKY